MKKNSLIENIENKIKKVAKVFDEIASWAVVAAMLLVVSNVIMRVFFKKPFLGAYEYTGFLTALIVGFGISYCLVLDAHIAIDFVTNKLKKKSQKIIDTITNSVSFIIMSVFTYNIFKYATQLLVSNSVSPTTQTPFYIVVYLIGVCFVLLCLVLLIRVHEYAKGGSSL